MYILPFLVILVICLAIFLSPILAVIVFVLFLIGLGAYKFFGQGTDSEHGSPPAEATPPAHAPGAARTVEGSSEEEDTGIWGERWPEQRSGEEAS
jgi:hypothetical protein